MRAISSYLNLDEATAVTQQVLALHKNEIDAWLADPTGGDRLVVSMSRPITSPVFTPIGIVQDRNSPGPLPGNGARVILARAPGSASRFTVITSYPTLRGYPLED